MSETTQLSRRQFFGAVGGVIGATAMTSMAFGAEPEQNMPEVDAADFQPRHVEADVLVVGGGMAALFAAVKAYDAGARVVMVSKGRIGSSGLTPFAKGIFSYDKASARMSIDEFVATVGESALGTNNPVFTRQLAEHSYARVQELKAWGFFDSPLYHDCFMRPISARNIAVHERVMVTHLHKQQGRVGGASGFSLDTNTITHFAARSVVLCTGAGGFKPSGFPVCDLTHDGSIMAYKIGARITGKEWNDGHPGSAKNTGSSYDNWHGQVEEKPSVTEAQINHHLGVDMNYRAYTQGGPAVMGPPPGGKDGEMPDHPADEVAGGPYVPPAFRMTEPPPRPEAPGGLLALFRTKRHDGPPGMGGEQVGGSSAGMAIHKSEGLVPVNETGLSTIPGLYAAGDALGSHMSGGIYTQIGGSLAGSAVQGAIAGEAAATASRQTATPAMASSALAQIEEEILAPLKRAKGYSPAWVTQVLQGVMIPNFVLYIKKGRMLQSALGYVEELKEHHVPMLMAKDRHQLRLAHETENMVISAEMKLRASLMRTESRCSHFRLDYPDVDNENWQAWLNLWQDENGQMQFEKQPFNTWPSEA